MHWNHIFLDFYPSWAVMAALSWKLPFDTYSRVFFLNPENIAGTGKNICLETRYRRLYLDSELFLWIIFYKYHDLFKSPPCCYSNRSNCWLQHLKIVSWHHLMVYSSKSFLLQFKSNLELLTENGAVFKTAWNTFNIK